ncbi:reverse transcriptase domain-containing protein [Tanacetum coccineum]
MANTTPIVTTVTKPATKEKMPKEADATPWGNIQDFCEKHYEDILPVIMEKIRRNKRKEVHARLDFKESPSKKRIREGSKNSSVRTLSVRARLIELVILTRQAQLNLDQTEQTPGIVPIVEVALTRMTLLTEIILKAETALVQKKYVKDPVEIHNVKQRDGETIEEFMERFKLETKRMKGAPECIRIFGFMHGVNNPELTKCLNEHVPKTMEEMMVTTIAFIRGEAAATGKKKGHTSSRTEGPLVIEAEIGGHMIHRMYVDGGDADHSTRAWMNFMIVRSLSPYNGIIGRPEIREIKDVPSIAHGMHKFPVDGGIVTIHNQLIKQIISCPDVAGRLQKWSVMLGEHNITFWPRTSVKGQILMDFLIEKPDESLSDTSVDGMELTYALRFLFTTSNNEAEYEALITGLRIAPQMGVHKGTLPDDKREASKLRIKARQYKFLERVLYRRSFLKPWLRPGDFVYRSNNASHAVGGGKLGPKWEGPYEVMEALGDGAYKLRAIDGMVLPRTSILQQDGKTLRSNGGHGYWDSIIPSVVGGTGPMGAAHHPTRLLFLSATYVSCDGVL